MASSPFDTMSQSVQPVELQLVSKPNTTSTVWKYFALDSDEQGHCKTNDTVICRLCNNEVIAKC